MFGNARARHDGRQCRLFDRVGVNRWPQPGHCADRARTLCSPRSSVGGGMALPSCITAPDRPGGLVIGRRIRPFEIGRRN
jgi:hypothetical protein